MDIYLHDEEGGPAHDATEQHDCAGDPVLIGGGGGGGLVVAAAVRGK